MQTSVWIDCVHRRGYRQTDRQTDRQREREVGTARQVMVGPVLLELTETKSTVLY
jgi:hypothetical protein